MKINLLVASLFISIATSTFAGNETVVKAVDGYVSKTNKGLEFTVKGELNPKLLNAPQCELLVNQNAQATLEELDDYNRLVLKNGKSCQVDSVIEIPVVESPIVTMTSNNFSVTKEDVMSREFTTDLAEILPDPSSKRPSAIILMKDTRASKASNLALCEGFVSLQTIEEAETSTKVSVENQVVTKMPVLTKIDQNTTDCKEILNNYNYDAIKFLSVMSENLQKVDNYSTGPFVAVFYPNSMEVQQVIDLRSYSPEQIKAFGQKWHEVFHIDNTQASNPSTMWEKISKLLKSILNIAVCGEPNLVYAYNPEFANYSSLMCKVLKESK